MVLRALIFALLLAGADGKAALIPLFQKQNPAIALPGFDESVNKAPAFYVWQNDPGLGGVSDLCIPSTLSNILLYQHTQRTPLLTELKLPGITEDRKSIDSSLLVNGFLNHCGINNEKRTNPVHESSCIAKIYRDSGYSNAKVKLIRNLGIQEVGAGVDYLNRAPTIHDIRQALKDGYEVSMAIAFMKWDANQKKWIKTGSHAINVFGYSSNTADQDREIVLYISNPTRSYRMNFVDPIFETISLEENTSLEALPAPYSNVEVKTIEGRLINFEGKSTFLAGLILVKPN